MTEEAPLGDADPDDALGGETEPQITEVWHLLFQVPWGSQSDQWRKAASAWRDVFVTKDLQPGGRDALREARALLAEARS
jgi:hypothetical protein